MTYALCITFYETIENNFPPRLLILLNFEIELQRLIVTYPVFFFYDFYEN